MAEPFIGEIRAFSFNFAPQGWAFCDGAEIAIHQNPTLYALLGTQFGGDGRNNFRLPDLRGRTPIHRGPYYKIGNLGGEESVALLPHQMAAHTHGLVVVHETGSKSNVGPNADRLFGISDESVYSSAANLFSMDHNTCTITGEASPLPHNNMQPSSVLNYCIALRGIFPSRN